MSYSITTKLLFLIIVSIFAVSISPIISNYLSEVSYVSKSFWRMAIASVIMWLFTFRLNHKPIGIDDRMKIFFAGALLGLHFILFYGSIDILRETGGVNQISNATVLGTLAPVFVLIIERVVFKKQFSGMVFLSLAVALTGSILIFYNDLSFSSELFVGNAYAILCSILLSITFIISTDIRKRLDTMRFSRLLYTSAAVTCLAALLISKDSIVAFSRQEFFMLAVLGVVPTLFGHNIFYYLVGQISPVTVSAIPLAEPIVSTLLSVIIFNLIMPSSVTMLGGMLTISGLGLLIYFQADTS